MNGETPAAARQLRSAADAPTCPAITVAAARLVLQLRRDGLERLTASGNECFDDLEHILRDTLTAQQYVEPAPAHTRPHLSVVR